MFSNNTITSFHSAIACDEEFTSSPGIITSPNYPENYPDEATCNFKITAPADKAVVLVRII